MTAGVESVSDSAPTRAQSHGAVPSADRLARVVARNWSTLDSTGRLQRPAAGQAVHAGGRRMRRLENEPVRRTHLPSLFVLLLLHTVGGQPDVKWGATGF